jgi:ankyrin repeat protein
MFYEEIPGGHSGQSPDAFIDDSSSDNEEAKEPIHNVSPCSHDEDELINLQQIRPAVEIPLNTQNFYNTLRYAKKEDAQTILDYYKSTLERDGKQAAQEIINREVLLNIDASFWQWPLFWNQQINIFKSLCELEIITPNIIGAFNRNALHWAAFWNNIEAVHYILEKLKNSPEELRAMLDLRQSNGQTTPLEVARATHNEEIAELLIQAVRE